MDIGKKISMTQDEAAKLKTLAKEGVTSRPKIIDLTRSLKQEKQASAFWKSRYDELREQTKDYIAAVKHALEGIDLDTVKKARHIVLVSGGAHRAPAIRATIRRVGCNTLITDEGAAQAMLRLAETSAAA